MNEEKTQSRKWQLTINNPIDHDLTHDNIKEIMKEFKSVIYWCMADEIGHEEQTPHTHLYMCSRSGIRFTTVKKKFPTAHIENCNGTSLENKEYVFKSAEKYHKDSTTGDYEYKDSSGKLHKGTHYDDTNEEYGEMPVERQGSRTDLKELYNMIKDGCSTYEILEENPQYLDRIDKIEKVRQTLLEEKYKDTWRNLDVTYIWGVTGSGKTRSVMDKFGYSNVYRVTDYDHPFDAYKGQDVIVFEEFRSSLRIDDMLKYLDGYPVEFPARYMNKQACFTKVYIISNIDLKAQYPNVQKNEERSWDAFIRRIQTVQVFDGKDVTIMDTPAYMAYKGGFFMPTNKTPFDKQDKPTQLKMKLDTENL